MKYPKDFDFSITYYLAGPMTGHPDFNYPAFQRYQDEMVADGVLVKSPHKVELPDRLLEGEELWKVAMRLAMRMLLDCEGIILMNGFTKSKGAMVEFNIATALHLPVYFLDGKYLVTMHTTQEVPTA